ncbi:protein DMP3 [Prunus dulcis]|uniref:protein DMP3 n=1 Tax=Prunus dulcis TaxID=3755 RepID=UPI001482CD32|nr:protein DMP3 [Prunus dulcis]
MAELPSPEQPRPPSSPSTMVKGGSNYPVHQTLASAANLANLLPTGTVLAFQTLIPTFSNNGSCQLSNNFKDNDTDGKLYYGIATFKGLYIFNYSKLENINTDLEKYKIKFLDFVHAFMSLFVFLIFALSNSHVQSCFLSALGINYSELAMNLPLGAGILSSFFFTIFPTARRGIGYTDMVPQA